MKSIIIPFLFTLLVILSCKSDSKIEPVEIYYGGDVCEKCKMIISEKPFSAEYLIDKGKTKKFDDLGCMFHYIAEEEVNQDKISSIFVIDYYNNRWINGSDAYYVWSKNLTTPMDHGFVAIEKKETAEKLANSINGKVIGIYKDVMELLSGNRIKEKHDSPR